LNWLNLTSICKHFKIEDRGDRKDETYAATGRPSRKGKVLETGRGSTRSYSVENPLGKSLWTRRKTDYDNEGNIKID